MPKNYSKIVEDGNQLGANNIFISIDPGVTTGIAIAVRLDKLYPIFGAELVDHLSIYNVLKATCNHFYRTEKFIIYEEVSARVPNFPNEPIECQGVIKWFLQTSIAPKLHSIIGKPYQMQVAYKIFGEEINKLKSKSPHIRDAFAHLFNAAIPIEEKLNSENVIKYDLWSEPKKITKSNLWEVLDESFSNGKADISTLQT